MKHGQREKLRQTLRDLKQSGEKGQAVQGDVVKRRL